MRHNGKILLQYLPWLLLLLAVDGFSVLLLWLADVQALLSMALIIVLATAFLFTVICLTLFRLERKKEQAFLAFLAAPDSYHEELLCKASGHAQRKSIRQLGQTLRGSEAAYTALQEQLSDYQEYVESWAHETKTPLSLLTLLLDNRREDLPAGVSFKLDYIQNRMQESVEQMLFYARIKSEGKDYLFEPIEVARCVQEVLENYRPLLDEKQFLIRCDLSGSAVYSDQRGLRFLLGQLVSNSINYCSTAPQLIFSYFEQDGAQVLSIRDNGIGVRSCDLPYLFEKGFTGNSGDERKKATGMGLYLVKELAKDLNITLKVHSVWQNGFEMQLFFPIVTET